METVNEQSTAYLTVTFKDKAGAAVSPASASYRIDDVQSGTAVRADTALTPAAQVEITLSPTDNTLVDPTKRQEIRRLTVTGVYGASDKVSAKYDYQLANLTFIT